MSYQTKTVQDFVEVLESHQGAFEKRRRGDAFKAIMFTLADAFPEDRPSLYQNFGTAKWEKKIKSGGANITRKKNVKTQVKDDCDGCGSSTNAITSDTEVFTANDQSNGDTIAADDSGTTTEENQEKSTSNEELTISSDDTSVESPENAFSSVEKVLERFESNGDAIAAFALEMNISIPAKVRKAETMAKYIVEHYQKEQ